MHANPKTQNGSTANGQQTAAAAARSARRTAVRAPIPSVRDAVYVLFKHQRKAVAVAAGVVAASLLAAVALPSRYTSEAQLLVRLGRESMPNSTVAGGPQAMPMVDRTTEINSEAQIVRSMEVIQGTIDRVGVATLLGEAASTDAGTLAKQRAKAARLLASKMDVRTEPMSAIVKVGYDAKSPEAARKVVQAYVDSYLDHRAEIYGGNAAGDLFTGLTRDVQSQLDAVEKKMKALKDSSGVSDVDGQKAYLLSRVAQIQSSLDTANAQLTATIGRVAALEDQRASAPREITLSSNKNEPMSVVSNAETELNKLRADLDAKMATYLPSSPTILQLQAQITLAERRLADLGDAREPRVIGLNPTWAELDKSLATERANVDGLDAQVQSLFGELSGARKSLAQMNEVELEMASLSRERDNLIGQLKKLNEGRDFSTIDQAMGKDRVGSVVVSQAATTPSTATFPNRPLLLLFGMFAAAVCGSATAAVAEMLDPNVGKPQDLKKLGFKRVVSIPTLSMAGDAPPASAEKQALRELADRDDASPASPRPLAQPKGHLLDRVRAARIEQGDRPASPYAAAGEPSPANGPAPVALAIASDVSAPRKASLAPRFLSACHNIVERLIIAPAATGELPLPRSIAVVSITPGQGATTVATHLAAALAAELDVMHHPDDRVLLVDANFQRPGVAALIGADESPAAFGDELRVQRTSVDRLDVLEARDPSQPGRRWADAVADALEGKEHLVVVDLPCMADSEAAARIAGACDAAILVVRAGDANREVVRQAARRLAESGVRVLGAVLNRRAYPIPDRLYRFI